MGEKLNPNENVGVIEGEFEEGSVSYVPPEVGDEPTKPESDTETPAG